MIKEIKQLLTCGEIGDYCKLSRKGGQVDQSQKCDQKKDAEVSAKPQTNKRNKEDFSQLSAWIIN